MSIPNENAEQKAHRLGLVLVRPGPDELFVDLDTPAAVDTFQIRLIDLRQSLPAHTPVDVKYTRSKGGGYHAYVRVAGRVFDRLERIAMQAALGSDPLRELIAVQHLAEGYECENVFFEVPGREKMPAPIAGLLSQPLGPSCPGCGRSGNLWDGWCRDGCDARRLRG